ncbi:YbfB/YjiJ family MFS transporter [Psychrobacter sp. DM4]|uniref:YbfB/YjiJ family MFS transporter n=1 Tax=Psychrobacter sp. DM4 TaxID=3440637 RepID=UPI003F5061CF
MKTSIINRMAPRITNQTYIAFTGLYCLAVVMGYGRFLFTATLPDIMTQLTLSTTIAGWLASVNYMGYFIGALIAMFVPERTTWQTLILWTAMSIITTMMLVLSNMPLMLWYVVRLLAGIASGIAMILSTTLVIQNFSAERRSLLSTVHYAGIGVGISASAILTWGLLALGYHFDMIWLIAGISSLPLLWLLLGIRPSSTAEPNLQPRSIRQTYINFKRSLIDAISGNGKAISLLSASYVLAGFGYITSTTFLPVMATNQMANAYAGLQIWLVVGVCIIVFNPIWGILAKRIGEINTLIGLTLLQAFGMFSPLWFSGALGLYANAIIIGMTFAGMVSMTLNIIKNMNPVYSNLLVGLATLAYALGQFIGPLVTVALAGDSDNFDAGLLAAGIGLFIGLVLLLWFRQLPQKAI